jgi:ribosomal protein S13
MNNEPVAWLLKENPQVEGEVIPLYTHPVKELTDEEIHNLMDEIEVLVHGDIKRAMYRMARKVESILNE